MDANYRHGCSITLVPGALIGGIVMVDGCTRGNGNGNGHRMTNEELRAAELAIIEDERPAPLTDDEVRRINATPFLANLRQTDSHLQCWGACSPAQPCSNCRFWRNYVRLYFHRMDYGRPLHPSDLCEQGAKPRIAAAIILQYFREKYDPVFRRGAYVCCANGEEITMQTTCVPDSVVLMRLASAADAPRDKHGAPDPDRLPGLFRKWAPVAWGDLRGSLPDEVRAVISSEAPAAEAFLRLVREAMCTQLTLGDVIKDTGVTQTERRSLIGWCVKFAKPGPWRDVRSLACWCRCREMEGGELTLQVAIRHQLFAQVGADRRLREMGPTMFGRLAVKYGVGMSTERDRPHGRRAIVLAGEIVADLTAGVTDTEDLPAASPDNGSTDPPARKS